MLTKSQVEKFKQQLIKQQERIAKERNGLRALLEEYEALADDCYEAMENIDLAVDALSRLQ